MLGATMSQSNSLDPNGEIIDVGRIKPRRPRRLFLLAIAGIVLLLFVFGSRGLSIYTSALWFSSLGYSAVFWYIFKLKLVLFLIFFALTEGSSRSSMIPLGDDADFDIFAVGSWRSAILAVSFKM